MGEARSESTKAINSTGRKVSSTLSDKEFMELKDRMKSLEDKLEMLGAEFDVLSVEARSIIKRSRINFANQFYFKGGLMLVLPRQRTFPFKVDSGLGAFAGIGHYIGENHVVDLAFEWDIYLSMTLKYRYEFHLLNPDVTIGPVIGGKIKAAPIGPFDDFLDNRDGVRNSYFIFGLMLGFPIQQNLVSLEFLYLYNQQALLCGTAGIHLFL